MNDLGDAPIWTSGDVECDVCGQEHLSVHAVVSERLECPNCGYMTPNPDYDMEAAHEYGES